jgi:hypothetical protein
MDERYKGRWVDPRAYELSNGSGWDAEVYIAEDVGSETVDTQYSLTRTFPTRETAIEAALNAGKRKVDENIRSDDIKSVIDEGTRLPSTYRRGHGTDDVAEGADGLPTKVDRPLNPEDIYLK